MMTYWVTGAYAPSPVHSYPEPAWPRTAPRV
jgi:hypothetical protein